MSSREERREPRIHWCGDEYVLIEMYQPADLAAIAGALRYDKVIRTAMGAEILDSLPGWKTLLLRMAESRRSPAETEARIREALAAADDVEVTFESRRVTVPVLYGEAGGPDLEFVAEHNRIPVEETVRRLATSTHFAGMVSFTPGMANCMWLEEDLALSAPKYQSPRTTTPTGTVGLGGSSIAMYSLPSPGGFQMVGVASVPLYAPEGLEIDGEVSPALFRPGDRITLRSVQPEEHETLGQLAARGEYKYEVSAGSARVKGGTITWT